MSSDGPSASPRAAAAALALAGCSVLAYPSPSSEAAACSDGQDNDFDGLGDCYDPDCVGHCVEDGSAVSCSNAVDDDDDDLVDTADPGCWASLGIDVDRACLGVAGSSVGWSDIEWVRSEDTSQAAPGAALVLAPDRAAYAFGSEVLTGRLDDIELSFEMEAVPERGFEVGLLRDGRESGLALGVADGVGLVVVPTGIGRRNLFANFGGNRRELVRDLPSGARLRVRMRTIRVEDTYGLDGSTIYVDDVLVAAVGGWPFFPLPPDWGDAPGLRPYARAEAAPGEVRLHDFTVTRLPRSACGFGSQPAFARRVLAAIELSDGSICAVGVAHDDPAPDTYSSSLELLRSPPGSCGASFEAAGPLPQTFTNASAAALAQRPDGSIVLAVAEAEGSRLAFNRIAQARIIELGAGCRAEGATEPGAPVPFAVLRTEGTVRATMFGLELSGAGATDLVVWVDDGRRIGRVATTLPAASFRSAASVDLSLPLDLPMSGGITSFHGNAIVGFRLYSSANPGELVAFVAGDDGTAAIVPLFTPGEPPGAFDDSGGAYPTLVPFEPGGPCAALGIGDGLLFEYGLPSLTASRSLGAAVFPFRVRRTSPSGADAGVSP